MAQKCQLGPTQVLKGFWSWGRTQGNWKSLKVWFDHGLKLLQISPLVLPPQGAGTGMPQPCGDCGTHETHTGAGGTAEIHCGGLAGAPGHGSLHRDMVAWQWQGQHTLGHAQHSGGDKQHGQRRLGQPEGRKRVAATCWDLRAGAGTEIFGSGGRSGQRDAQQQVCGAMLRMLNPMGSPSHGHSPCPRPLEGLGWLRSHPGLLWCCGSGPMSGSSVHCPAAQLSRAAAFQTTTALAGSAAPPSQSQTLPGAKSCSIYWPQAELTAAS